MTTTTTKKVAIEWDLEAQKQLPQPLGTRELWPNCGTYLAETLKEHDITFAFGVPGGHIWHFIDGISRIGIKTITFGHEQNGVFAAEAYAQVARRPAVCYATVGPGVGYAVASLQQAWLSNTPLLFLCGGHEIEHDKLWNTIQESYATELLGSITKWAQRVVYPNTVKQFTTRAFKEMQTFPYGPVCLELGISALFTPKSANDGVWWGAWGEHATWIPNWRGADTAKPISSGGDPAEVAKAVQEIYAAKAPFMMLGDGAHWADAGPEIQEFVELAQVPFTTRRLGRGVVSEKHPLALRGQPGISKDIDLMVPVGMKVGFFDGFGGGWPNTVQIAESNSFIWTYVPTSCALVGSPKVVFRQMIDYIKANNLQPPAGRAQWVAKCQKANAESTKRRREKANHYQNVHPRYQQNNFMHHGPLSQMTVDFLEQKYESRNRILIDGYTMSDFAMPYLVATRGAQILSASDSAGVGHGVAMAMGAAFADMERGDNTPILALMGDSGFGNAGMELETAVRHKLPIVYQVTNNDGWMPGMKYVWYGENWEVLGEQDRQGTEFQGAEQRGQERVPGARYDLIAQAMGAYAETVTRHEDYPAALARAFESAEKGVPAVLNCIMDKHLVNKAVTSAVYALMYAHLPYDELPKRGKAVRRLYWGKERVFSGLKDYPKATMPDPWEPLSDDEILP